MLLLLLLLLFVGYVICLLYKDNVDDDASFISCFIFIVIEILMPAAVFTNVYNTKSVTLAPYQKLLNEWLKISFMKWNESVGMGMFIIISYKFVIVIKAQCFICMKNISIAYKRININKYLVKIVKSLKVKLFIFMWNL